MAENIIVVGFKVESEAYQALSELKQNPITNGYAAIQGGIIKKEAGIVSLKDGYDTGAESSDDTLYGGLIGGLAGILGGPIGVLLGGSWGALVGSAIDTADEADNISLIEKVCEVIPDNSVSLVALVSEEEAGSFGKVFDKYDTEITCFDAAEVADEIRRAEELQAQLRREAREKLREDKKEARRQKIEENRAKLKADFESFKARFTKKEQ